MEGGKEVRQEGEKIRGRISPSGPRLHNKELVVQSCGTFPERPNKMTALETATRESNDNLLPGFPLSLVFRYCSLLP